MKVCVQELVGVCTVAKTGFSWHKFFGPSGVTYRHFNLGSKSKAKLGLETTVEILRLALSRVTAEKSEWRLVDWRHKTESLRISIRRSASAGCGQGLCIGCVPANTHRVLQLKLETNSLLDSPQAFKKFSVWSQQLEDKTEKLRTSKPLKEQNLRGCLAGLPGWWIKDAHYSNRWEQCRPLHDQVEKKFPPAPKQPNQMWTCITTQIALPPIR